MARAATNTDAIVLEILTEAQQALPSARSAAGPCPLRGMRRASVVAADAPGVRLAATASLLLGAAKIRDHVEDGDAHRMARRPLTRVSTRWHARARDAAAPLGLDVEPLIAAIESQLRLENSPTSTLDELTGPTQLCAGELFAHTAILADRPENADALREAGWHFGRIAHLADALEDLESDRAQGHFNPLLATGTSPEQAHALVAESNTLLRAALTRVALDRTATIRWILLDPLGGVVRKLGRAAGIAHTCTAGACRTARTDAPSTVTELLETSPGVFEGGAATRPRFRALAGLSTPGRLDRIRVLAGRAAALAPHAGQPWPPPGPGPQFPPPAPGPQFVPQGPGPGPQYQPWQPGAPFTPQPGMMPPGPGMPPPPPPPRGPSLLEGLGIICTQYCTGYACCASHTGPCSGHHKGPWFDRGCRDDCCECGCNCGCECCCESCCDGCCDCSC
ncbi:hypothetical protein GCM10027167_27110 [Nocardia heshunensis]